MADYEALKTAVISGKVAQVKELTQQALDAGTNPQEVLDQGLIPAMDIESRPRKIGQALK
jgi:5-methyltetrahydrofolate--homocysteine methyltransferase